MLVACTSRQGGKPATFNVKIEDAGQKYPVLKSGAVAVPVGKTLLPGDTYGVTVTAPANTPPMSSTRLNFASIFVQPNDFFNAFPPEGLALFKPDGTPLGTNGPEDVVDQVQLYDAGIKINEEPGVGPNQKPTKQGPNSHDVGTKESAPVQPVSQVNDGYSYPPVAAVVRVTITSP